MNSRLFLVSIVRAVSAIFIISILVTGCSKKDSISPPPPPPPPPPQNKITYSVDSASTQPGLYITIKASEPLTKDTCTILLAGKDVLLAKIDSTHYMFFVPVLSPGTYILDLKNVDAANSPSVVVRPYNQISDADKVIQSVLTTYNQFADTLLGKSINGSVTADDATYMHQLMDQFQQNLLLLTDDQKLLLAYQLQYLDSTVVATNHSRVRPQQIKIGINAVAKINEKVQKAGLTDDVSTLLLIKVGQADLALIEALKSAIGVEIVGSAAISGNPLVIAAFIITLADFAYSVNAAKNAFGEAVNFISIAESKGFVDANGNGTATNLIVAATGEILWETLKTSFRTIQESDESGPNDEIVDLLKENIKFQNDVNPIISIYKTIKSKFNSFFSKVTTTLNSYVSLVLPKGREEVDLVNNSLLSVSNVSNPDIIVTASDDGTKGLKLTFNNPNNNITAETNFSFQLTYTQDAIQNSVTLTEYAKFSPSATKSVYILKFADVNGNNQSGYTGKPLTNLLKVSVLNDKNTTDQTIKLFWLTTTTNGTVYVNSIHPDANGEGTATWTLGDKPGIQSLIVEASDANGNDIPGSPLTFNATAVVPQSNYSAAVEFDPVGSGVGTSMQLSLNFNNGVVSGTASGAAFYGETTNVTGTLSGTQMNLTIDWDNGIANGPYPGHPELCYTNLKYNYTVTGTLNADHSHYDAKFTRQYLGFNCDLDPNTGALLGFSPNNFVSTGTFTY